MPKEDPKWLTDGHIWLDAHQEELWKFDASKPPAVLWIDQETGEILRSTDSPEVARRIGEQMQKMLESK